MKNKDEFEAWGEGKNTLIGTLLLALTGIAAALVKKSQEKEDKKEEEDVIMETKNYKFSKKK